MLVLLTDLETFQSSTTEALGPAPAPALVLTRAPTLLEYMPSGAQLPDNSALPGTGPLRFAGE